MGANENLAVHSAWAGAENRHDLSRHHDFIHDDIEVHLVGREPIVGFDAYMAMMEENYSALEGFHTTLDDQFATDDRVVCRWLSSGTHSGEFNGLPPTGRRIEFAGVSLWEFDHGRARRGWVFPDVAALMTQLMWGPASAPPPRPDEREAERHERADRRGHGQHAAP
jgi:steroid delta-isomerase-like uncharacterized protein